MGGPSMIATLHFPASIGYAGVALLVGIESAGVPVPGETSLIAAAVLASQGQLSLPLVIATAAVAAIIGDNLGYLIGRRGGRWLFTRPGRWQQSRARLLERGEVFYARHGPSAVFLGRWIPWLRITAAWLAGANRMPWPRFVFWNALGGIAWATSIGVAAYFLGTAAAAVLGAVGLIVLALIVVGGLSVLFGHRLRRRHPAPRG
jgi:membrane protein DedA with SNARE-associated domain